MNCNCWSEINEKLKAKNLHMISATYLMPSFFLVPKIDTEWIDKDIVPKGQKRNPPGILASHCPFCGIEIKRPKYQEEFIPSMEANG